VVWWLAPSTHNKRVLGSIPGWDLSVWSLHVLPAPNTQKHACFTLVTLNCPIKLDCCLHRLSLCGPVMDW